VLLRLLTTFLSVFPLFVFMVKSNIAEVATSSGTTGLTLNLSVTCPPSAIDCIASPAYSVPTDNVSIYYLYPVFNGYYPCGLQMGNQSVQYVWSLNVSATPKSLASGAVLILEAVYEDTLPGKPYYTEKVVIILDENGEGSTVFEDCITPRSIFPESTVSIRVIEVKSASGQTLNYTANAVVIIPEQ